MLKLTTFIILRKDIAIEHNSYVTVKANWFKILWQVQMELLTNSMMKKPVGQFKNWTCSHNNFFIFFFDYKIVTKQFFTFFSLPNFYRAIIYVCKNIDVILIFFSSSKFKSTNSWSMVDLVLFFSLCGWFYAWYINILRYTSENT